MRKPIAFFALVGALSGCADAPDGSHPPCHATATSKGRFSSPASDDTLTATVKGAPCYQGRFRIEIRNASGDVVYRYDEPFERHVVESWDGGEELLAAASDLVRDTAEGAFSHTSAELPPFLPPAELYEEHYTWLKVPENRYRSLRDAKSPAFQHATHYEGWRWVVYDASARRAVVVAEGGL